MSVLHDTVIASATLAAHPRLAVTGKSTNAQERDLFDRALITHNKQVRQRGKQGQLAEKTVLPR